jgi:hypothetical protein
MNPRLVLVILMVIAASAEAGRVCAEDLEPEEGVFAGDSALGPYELVLRRSLLDGDRYRLCQLVVVPSFSAEMAVYMVSGEEPGEAFTVIARTMKKQLWNRMMKELEKGRQGESISLDDAAQSTALQKLRTAVDTRTATLDLSTGERIAQVCENVLRRVRYPQEDVSGLDGTTYHAGHWVPGAFLAGKTWSPEKGTLAASFVEMELALKKYAEVPVAQRSAAKEDLIRMAERIEKQLAAKNSGAEPANRALQRPEASGVRR